MNTRYVIGKTILWAGWPFFYFYLKGSVRTRVLITCGQSALLIKEWHGAEKWSLPGGGVHKNESVKLSAVREVYEEIGLTLSQNSLKYLDTVGQSQYGISFSLARFALELPSRLEPKRRKLEITDCAWVDLKKLNEKNTEKSTLDHIAKWRSKK
jgi:8-oxo-dGTP pyrophosphatase MutT (NUDIX family)